ncbi:hypothetical protein EDB85DRAFT_1866111, partial [Lactarius pseudohatsudake]
LWSIYLTEAEKQDSGVTENWKGDTDGILVFTGLFSATVTGFIVESYKKLSPDSSDTTNALLAQISYNSSTSLMGYLSRALQSASAVRVNVLWFLSLVLSMNCALSATWARRYQELAQRRGAFHRRGHIYSMAFPDSSRQCPDETVCVYLHLIWSVVKSTCLPMQGDNGFLGPCIGRYILVMLLRHEACTRNGASNSRCAIFFLRFPFETFISFKS